MAAHLAGERDRGESAHRARPDPQRRSALSHRTAFEWVDYGSRTIGADNFPDRYYRIDADLGYRLWVYPLEELRVGYTRLFGDTTSTDPMTCGGVAGSTCQVDAGFKVGGWFELGLAPVEGFRLDARAMVLANANGFGVGGRLEARLGEREGSHIALRGARTSTRTSTTSTSMAI